MKTIIAVSILILFAACQKKTNDAPIVINVPPDTAGSTVALDSFPLQVGNSWTYIEQAQTNMTPLTKTTAYSYTVSADTVVNGMKLYKISGVGVADGTLFSNNFNGEVGLKYTVPYGNYYTNTSAGLYSLPYTDSMGNVSFKIDSAGEVLKFPVTLTDSWVYEHTNVNTPYPPSRRWVSYVKISTPAGVFDCIKLSTFIVIPYTTVSVNTYQYYSSKGLIKMVQEEWGEDGGEGVGQIHIITTITLSAVNF